MLNVSGTAGVNTDTVTLGGFTDQNTYASADDYSVSIDWGDDSGTDDTTGEIDSLSDGNFQVTGDHTYAAAGTYTVTTTVTEDDGGATTTFTSTATVVAAWSMVGSLTGQRTNDPNNADLQSIGEATVDLNQGALRLSAALDFDQSPGSDVGGDPALVYNSATVNVLPVIQLAVQGDAGSTAPTQAVVQLTWNGVAQTPVTYDLDQQAGSVYLFGVQPDSPVETSGAYDWSATVTFSIPGQDDEQAATSGTAYVVSNAGSAYGAGWGIDGISQLVVGSTGAMMVTGEGDSEFFAANGTGGFTSPPYDFGTLVQNADGSYTYTAVDQTQYNYNSLGYLTSVVDTHGLATTYTYDDENRLIQVTASDGGVTTLSYDATTGLLDSITEPGNRTLTLVHDSYGNITQITDVDGTTRSFGYADGGNHLITEDQWDPLDATFSYNTATNQLTQVNLGLGSVYTIVSAASDGLGTSAATGAAWASITDGDGDTTKYLLDSMGRLLEEVEPDGTSTYQYVLNAAGLPIVSIDPMGRVTLDSYDAYGDLLQETEADGSWTQYQYDPTFHEVTATLNSMGQTTSNTYDPVTGDLLTSTDAMGAVTTYTYYQTDGISNGLVYSVTTPDENGTATSYYYYDADRRLIESVDPMGIPTYYTYDANGNPLTTTDAYGQTTTTVYSPRGFLLESIDALGAVTSYTYDAYGLQTSTTDARGFTSTTTYDQRGWQTAQTDDMGVIIEEDTYDAAGDLLSQTDADGNTTDFVYNADGDQVETIYPDGTSSSETFDADGEVVSSTDEMGLITTYAYNSMGEEVSTTDPMGRTTTAEYDSDGDVIRITDPMGLSTLDFYNADGEEIASSQQVSGTVWATDTTQYDLAGDEISSTDAMGLTTTYNYNADGEEISSTDPDGNTSTNVYDLDGNLIRSTDADGNVTTYAYNADGEQISSTDPDGNVTQTVYDADGNVIATIGPKGTTTTTYNGDDEAVSSTDADGNVTQMVYDNDGNVIESIDPTGAITRTWYNDMGEAVLSEDPDGNFSQTVYNGDGEVVATTDGAGDLTQNAYDADGEQISTRDGDGNVTQYAYNADGQQISETDADNNTTTYVLDGLGDTIATVDPLGNVTQSVYNLDGLLVSTTDADGRTSSYQYDHDGNLLTETDYNADGTVQDTKSYTYDADGNMLTASNSYGTYTYTYDGDGNVLTQTDPFGLTLTYGYDGDGNVTSEQDSLGGDTTNVYDPDDQLTSVQFTDSTSQARLDLSYTPDDQVSTMNRYSDLAGTQLVSKSTYDYDAAGNTTEIKHVNASGSVLGDYVYSYDKAERVSSETDTENGGSPVTTTYTYDAASQLTSVNGTDYTYDANGNQTMNGISTGPGNRLLTDGTWNYSYDAVGNTIEKVNIATGEYWTYAWNDANQMTLASDYNANGTLIQSVTFQYDALGNQVEQDVYTASTNQTVTTKYAYDVSGNIWADLNGSNQLVDRRLFVDVNGQMQPFVRIDASGNVAWYLTDDLGSIRLLTDNTGTVIDQIDYDAYGNITNETDPANGDRYKYASGQYNAILGLTYFGEGDGEDGGGRWDDAANGTWLSADPTGLAAGPNPYDYVGNDPMNAIDPTGLDSVEVDGGTLTSTTTTYKAGNPLVAGEETIQPGVKITFTSPKPLKANYLQVKQWTQIEVRAIYENQDEPPNSCQRERLLPAGVTLDLDEKQALEEHGHVHRTATKFRPNLQTDNGHGVTRDGFSLGICAQSRDKKTYSYTDDPNASALLHAAAKQQVIGTWGKAITVNRKKFELAEVQVVQRFVTVVYLDKVPVRTIHWTATARDDVTSNITVSIVGAMDGWRGLDPNKVPTGEAERLPDPKDDW